MTYNFDPDRWHDDEQARLTIRRQRGELSDEELAAALENLERRYEQMVARLDGTFTVARGEKSEDA